ncbi:MAG: DNA-binding protein [Clostridia bacterium]|nr:DNA-binding protein [Clostridia bacterium]
MSIKDGVHYAELYSEYFSLLTENQRSVFEMYCMCDLSLGEIAEIKGVSRQSVSDSVVKTKKALDETEQKLGVLAKKKAVYALIDQLNDKNAVEIGEKIKNILGEN